MTDRATTLFSMSDGAGEPLVLLNGIAMTAVSWEVVADQYDEAYRLAISAVEGKKVELPTEF